MREMPKFWSKKWRQLWFAGAIDQKSVFLRELGREFVQRQKQDPYYYSENLSDILAGRRIVNYSRGFVDLLAVVKQDLRMREKPWIEITTQLLGCTPYEADSRWH